MAVSAYQLIKLGMNLEYLAGVHSVSMMQTTSLVEFPNLMDNLAKHRYSVQNVVSAMKSVFIQLEQIGSQQTIQVADELKPMLAEMEQFLSRSPDPNSSFLNDHFANSIVEHAKRISFALKEEASTLDLN